MWGVNLSWHHGRGIYVFFLNISHTSSPECDPKDFQTKQSHHITSLVKAAFIASCTVIYFFQRMLNSFSALLITTSGLSTSVHGVSSRSVTEALSVSPGQRPHSRPWPTTAHHSFLIRGGGGGRVEYTSCCCWPAPSKQEDLLGLITLASPFPPPPANNKQTTTVNSLYFVARKERRFVFNRILVWVFISHLIILWMYITEHNTQAHMPGKRHWLHSSEACLDMCGCVSSVCLHSEFIFPSITQGGNIKAAMKTDSSISADSGEGGALIYL